MTSEVLRQTAGAAQRDDAWHRFCSRTSSTFLTPADDERRELNAFSNVDCADAFRRVKLVARNRKQIDRPVTQLDRNFADSLNAIDVESGVGMLANDFPDFLDWKPHTRFVVRQHDRNDACILPQRFAQ